MAETDGAKLRSRDELLAMLDKLVRAEMDRPASDFDLSKIELVSAVSEAAERIRADASRPPQPEVSGEELDRLERAARCALQDAEQKSADYGGSFSAIINVEANTALRLAAAARSPSAPAEENNWALFKASRYPETGDGSCRKCGFAPTLDHGFCQECAQVLGFSKVDGLEAAIKHVLFRRLLQSKMEGYTLETAQEIASLVSPSAPAGEERLREALEPFARTFDEGVVYGGGFLGLSHFQAASEAYHALAALQPEA